MRKAAYLIVLCIWWACKVPQAGVMPTTQALPQTFSNAAHSMTKELPNWRTYFNDPTLVALIDTALRHNQELLTVNQELNILQNEILARKGEYLPFVNVQAYNEYARDGKYTWKEGVNENLNKQNHPEVVESNNDLKVGLAASWELDVWHKLRNAKKAAATRYLAGVEGRHFFITQLVAEIAESWYQLMALDNLLLIVQQNIDLQADALKIVKLQKESAKVTQLAVNRFEAQLLNTQNLQYDIKQRIVETENHIHQLTGVFPRPLAHSAGAFNQLNVPAPAAGLPASLLANRPDIKQATLQIEAANIDVQVARAMFYPAFRLQAGVGLQAFSPTFLLHPQSAVFNLAGDMLAPLINKSAIKAAFASANARQIQTLYQYEQTIITAYIEVVNQLAKANNFKASYTTKAQEVDMLTQSVGIANNLFKSARADYMEVLLTQREALQTRMELIEIKLKQAEAMVGVYRALGGGWQ